MKKTVSVLISIMLTLMFCVGLTACGDTGSSNGNNNPSHKPFNVDLAGYVANIGTAKALGISKEVSSRVSPMSTLNTNSGIQLLSYTSLASNKDTEDKNYIVMSTVDYDANTPEADKTGLTKVTFTKIVTENVTTETTGTKYIIANESSISISATTGFKYTVYYNDSLIYNEVQDNDDNDKEPKEGVIVLDNLIDGIEYKVSYKGIGVETTITQDDINGEIDKLYVLNGYTFISFVPNGTSQRPHDDSLVFDTDGIAHYDKCNYFSNSARQSFIIDNTTGYVYQINNFNIKEIQGGCLLSGDDNFIYDFKINEKDEVEIFSLFTNDTIEWYSCFKDKYGNKFIQNNRLNTYDATTHTYFYVHEPFVNPEYEQYNGYIIYELTSNNEAIALYYSNNQTSARWSTLIDAYIILENGTKRELTSDDSFEIYYDWDKFNQLSYYKRYNINGANSHPEQDWTTSRSGNRTAYKVVNGVVYGYSHHKGYSQGLVLMQYDVVKKEATYLSLNYPSGAFVNTSNLEKHDILIEFQDGKLYYYSNVWDAYTQACDIHEDLFLNDSDDDKEYLSDYESFSANLVLENCSIDGIKDAVMAYGIHGNTYYEIVAEEVNGEVVIKQYVKGTYQKPQMKIILQPLNKNA